MCDTSIFARSSRRAVAEDQLHTSTFNGGAVGFAAKGRPHEAVCLLPGDVVRLDNIPRDVQAAHQVRHSAVVTFSQDGEVFRDGFIFPDGRFESVQNLFGVTALVEQLQAPEVMPVQEPSAVILRPSVAIRRTRVARISPERVLANAGAAAVAMVLMVVSITH